jgi:RNA polymerase sigma-70 factor, ECF subfamily
MLNIEPDDARAALDRALIELRPRLHRYCARLTGSVIDGEDVVQEVMIKAIEGFARAGRILSVEGWLVRIAHNVALNFVRGRARQTAALSNEDPTMIGDPVDEVQAREVAAASLRAFMHLSPSQRSTVILKDVLGYSLDEIGAITDSSLAATKANLRRGRIRLREFASSPEQELSPVLREPERSRLKRYVDRFNNRDFDAVRDMLADDVRLELVNANTRKGVGGVASYFGNYNWSKDWRLVIGFVDTRPAALVYDSNSSDRPVNFILVEWKGDKVTKIRDFVHASYAMDDAEILSAN